MTATPGLPRYVIREKTCDKCGEQSRYRHRPAQCVGCGESFCAQKSSAKYCSLGCQSAVKRTRLTLARLEAVADEYRQLLAAGERAPVRVIAERRGASRTTVRSWIHRARERGLLPPTSPGQASASDHEPRLVNVMEVIVSAIPVDPSDGTVIIGQTSDRTPLWGNPSTVAALIRDALTKAGLLHTEDPGAVR